jgi:hypothetical protein
MFVVIKTGGSGSSEKVGAKHKDGLCGFGMDAKYAGALARPRSNEPGILPVGAYWDKHTFMTADS